RSSSSSSCAARATRRRRPVCASASTRSSRSWSRRRRSSRRADRGARSTGPLNAGGPGPTSSVRALSRTPAGVGRAQALGRLPWLAALPFRLRRLRPRLLMVFSCRSGSAAGLGGSRRVSTWNDRSRRVQSVSHRPTRGPLPALRTRYIVFTTDEIYREFDAGRTVVRRAATTRTEHPMTHESWTVTGPQAIDLAHVRTLDATVIGGRLDVVAHDDPARTDVRVEVHSVTGRPLEVRLDGSTLRVGYGPFG